nr:aromatic amino acid DMT transporter YddG [Acinetobacter soli]
MHFLYTTPDLFNNFDIMTRSKANFIGITSIMIWACMVSGVKMITEQLGAILGVALIYSISALCVAFIDRKYLWQTLPRRYLLICGSCFVLYEVLFLCSIGLSKTREEALILAMINYLWPCFTLFLSYLLGQLNFKAPAFAGLILSILGLLLIVNPSIVSAEGFIQTLSNNPLAYTLAFCGAILWSLYCVFTPRYAQGKNGIALFFCLTSVALWLLFCLSDQAWQTPSLSMGLMIIVVGALVGIAYKNWNQSLQFGNIQLLLLASYFTPILSSLMSSLILHTLPSWSFWLGTLGVSFGAMLSWKFSTPLRKV